MWTNELSSQSVSLACVVAWTGLDCRGCLQVGQHSAVSSQSVRQLGQVRGRTRPGWCQCQGHCQVTLDSGEAGLRSLHTGCVVLKMYTLGERFGIALLMKMGMVHGPSQGKPYGITYDLEPEISESILFQNDTPYRESVFSVLDT